MRHDVRGNIALTHGGGVCRAWGRGGVWCRAIVKQY